MNTVEITLGNKTYRAAPVNIATLKKHKQFLQEAAAVKGGAPIDAGREIESMFIMAEIIHACIARVDPSITLAEVEGAIDKANLIMAYNTVMGVSGFVSGGAPGEATPAG